MYSVDMNIKEELEKINEDIIKKYGKVLNLNREEFRNFVTDKIGSIRKVDKATSEELTKYRELGGILGVDGSVNKKGSSYPHYIEVYKGLAKSTGNQKDTSKVKVYSPILESNIDNPLEDTEENLDKRDMILATLEIEVALEAIEKNKPYAILMDGSLIRYSIYAKDLWEELRYKCEEENILLLGVIEEIKTDIIGRKLYEEELIDDIIYDKEVLYGKLDYGEMIRIDDSINKKFEKAEISSIFIRSSKTPVVIGMDIIDIQRSRLEEMASLVLALTPETSRGIPLWLDIVDREVKISHEMLDAYLTRYLDPEIYDRFFVEMRSRRS